MYIKAPIFKKAGEFMFCLFRSDSPSLSRLYKIIPDAIKKIFNPVKKDLFLVISKIRIRKNITESLGQNILPSELIWRYKEMLF